jgi:hypothetical protein
MHHRAVKYTTIVVGIAIRSRSVSGRNSSTKLVMDDQVMWERERSYSGGTTRL